MGENPVPWCTVQSFHIRIQHEEEIRVPNVIPRSPLGVIVPLCGIPKIMGKQSHHTSIVEVNRSLGFTPHPQYTHHSPTRSRGREKEPSGSTHYVSSWFHSRRNRTHVKTQRDHPPLPLELREG